MYLSFCQVWWHPSLISAFQKQRQEDFCEFEVSLVCYEFQYNHSETLYFFIKKILVCKICYIFFKYIKLYFTIINFQRTLHTVSPEKPQKAQLISVSLNDFLPFLSLNQTRKNQSAYVILYCRLQKFLATIEAMCELMGKCYYIIGMCLFSLKVNQHVCATLEVEH